MAGAPTTASASPSERTWGGSRTNLRSAATRSAVSKSGGRKRFQPYAYDFRTLLVVVTILASSNFFGENGGGSNNFCCGFVPSLPGPLVGSPLKRKVFPTVLGLVETESPVVVSDNNLIPVAPISPPRPPQPLSSSNVTTGGYPSINASHQDGTVEDDSPTKKEESSASSQHDGSEHRREENRNETDADCYDEAQRITNTAKAAAFLARRKAKSRSSKSEPAKQTSVGERRVGSATNARRGRLSTTLLTDAIRQASSANTKPNKGDGGAEADESFDANQSKMKDKEHWSKSPSAAARLTSSAIHATVSEMLDQACRAGSIGIFGDPAQLSQNTMEPRPGTVLVHSSKPAYSQKSAIDRVTVRVATHDDDVDIANLRLSVFSDFSPEMRRSFCTRSCQVLTNRRMRGAVCIVATVPRYGGSILSTRSDIILGSAEVSTHEFEGTSLGRRRPKDSILYVTEVAVNPTARKKGIGRKMMQAIDELASIRGAETIYLHVDVTNYPALVLYKRSGYRQVAAMNPVYNEFTRSLNLHDGATRGRNHFLLQKNVDEVTWLPDMGPEEESRGMFGLEIPHDV